MSMKPANPKPCAHCPWRLSNQGKRHKDGFYTKRNLARLWAGLRRGARMTCHPTDPRMCEFEGYEQTADREDTHECTGALIVAHREFMRFSAIVDEDPDRSDTLAEYRRRYPRGMTREGLANLAGHALVTYPGEAPMARPDLNEPDVGYPVLGPWEEP